MQPCCEFSLSNILKSERYNLKGPHRTYAHRISEFPTSSWLSNTVPCPTTFCQEQGLSLSRGSDRVNNHSIARKTRGLNVNRMFVITARNHSTGQSHLIIMKKEDPGCSLRQRACFCLLQQPAEPVRWRRWPRSRDLPRHLTIDTSLVFVHVDPGE